MKTLRSTNKTRILKLTAMAGLAAVLAACVGGGSSADKTGGLSILSSKNGGTTTTVNRYLWSASLETLNFMPLATQDPISGVIVSEWYGNPQVPNERFKTQVYILDTALRADGLRVSVFKQQLTASGWIDAPVNPATGQEIENAILTRARALRLNSLD